MFMVKVGQEPYIGLELGFWDSWDEAVNCVNRYISKTSDEISWVNKGEGIWFSGSNWIHIYKIRINNDLF